MPRKPQKPAFHHLTLNTGHVSRQRRSETVGWYIDLLRPVIGAGSGQVPRMPGWYVKFSFPLDAEGRKLPGAALFLVSRHPQFAMPPVMGAVCCGSAAATEAVEMAAKEYGKLEAPLQALSLWRPFPSVGMPVPWMAVWLTPFFPLAGADVELLGGLEAHIAWALAAENEKRSARPHGDGAMDGGSYRPLESRDE